MYGSIGDLGHLARVAATPVDAPLRRQRRASARGAPLVGIVRNPRSHRNKGKTPELADCANILVETPRSHTALRATLAGFAERGIDYLAVDGGDGTVRDVLTCGAGIFGDDWPPLVILPKGKTNALVVDLGLPNAWTLAQAMEAIGRGKTIVRRPLAIDLPRTGELVHGFILGTGAFTRGTQTGQQAHRWGMFNSFAVGLIIVWCLIQTMFARSTNMWRKGTAMRLRSDGAELPRSRFGDPSERFVMVASTLERFPLGIRPFGKQRPGLKLAVIDTPLRWIVALMPLLLTGFDAAFLRRNGVHRIDLDTLDIELGDRFTLDGEYFPAGQYRLRQGPELRFVVP
ncbi:diacylglycerol kinase family protein [Novosphingobium sp. Gsoil 351]|uniref:diacylglycerol/lipid kinase family protein n=1 Tax=Novosphingobium sp. Gsoil 351 TaxID=2675225 RepID=UPI0012B4DA64|nr:diacylglycerol kinase family protein [Novosphingobium sp. Gsoil 351]QGN55547.1 diacylglycerol kinase [Novosphingobium sp. Gsoil 351]